jgi:hypothetical protein
MYIGQEVARMTRHVRYLRPDGNVRDEPSVNHPVHLGRRVVQWMKPEPMHAIQVVDRPGQAAADPSLLHIEIKFPPQAGSTLMRLVAIA